MGRLREDVRRHGHRERGARRHDDSVRRQAVERSLQHRRLGLLRLEQQRIGVVAAPYGEGEVDLVASCAGIIIGRANIPAINQGDALFHIAKVENASRLGAHYDRLERELASETMLDEDEII